MNRRRSICVVMRRRHTTAGWQLVRRTSTDMRPGMSSSHQSRQTAASMVTPNIFWKLKIARTSRVQLISSGLIPCHIRQRGSPRQNNLSNIRCDMYVHMPTHKSAHMDAHATDMVAGSQRHFEEKGGLYIEALQVLVVTTLPHYQIVILAYSLSWHMSYCDISVVVESSSHIPAGHN